MNPEKNDESRLSSHYVIWNILVFPIPTCACRCFSSIHRNGCSIFYLWFFYRLFSYPSFTSAKVFYHWNFGKRGEVFLSLSVSLSLSLVFAHCHVLCGHWDRATYDRQRHICLSYHCFCFHVWSVYKYGVARWLVDSSYG